MSTSTPTVSKELQAAKFALMGLSFYRQRNGVAKSKSSRKAHLARVMAGHQREYRRLARFNFERARGLGFRGSFTGAAEVMAAAKYGRFFHAEGTESAERKEQAV